MDRSWQMGNMDSDSLRVALVQLNCSDNEAANLDRAEALFGQAVTDGADLIAFPENMAAIWPGQHSVEAAEQLEGPRVSRIRGWAKRAGRWLLAGSVPIRSRDPNRIYNTSLLIDSDGELRGVYRKIHLFDVAVGNRQFLESDRVKAGDEIVVVPTPWGNLGMTVCYDLRFPELYVELVQRGADIIAVPSAFTYDTGKAHWSTLVRARALDTQCFVLAPNQVGPHGDGRHSWGSSMIVDPWGTILSERDDGEGLVATDLDLSLLKRTRERMPIQQHRKARKRLRAPRRPPPQQNRVLSSSNSSDSTTGSATVPSAPLSSGSVPTMG